MRPGPPAPSRRRLCDGGTGGVQAPTSRALPVRATRPAIVVLGWKPWRLTGPDAPLSIFSAHRRTFRKNVRSASRSRQRSGCASLNQFRAQSRRPLASRLATSHSRAIRSCVLTKTAWRRRLTSPRCTWLKARTLSQEGDSFRRRSVGTNARYKASSLARRESEPPWW